MGDTAIAPKSPLAITGASIGFSFRYYMDGTKAHGVSYLRDAIVMMFYKTKFNKEYNEIMSQE